LPQQYLVSYIHVDTYKAELTRDNTRQIKSGTACGKAIDKVSLSADIME